MFKKKKRNISQQLKKFSAEACFKFKVCFLCMYEVAKDLEV